MNTNDYAEGVFEAKNAWRRLAAAIAILVVFWGIGLFGFHSARDQLPRSARLGIIAVGTLVPLGLWLGRFVRLRVRHSDLVAEYQAWNVVVPYADIVDMDLVPQYWSSTSMSYAGNDVIVLQRRHGSAFKLCDFGEEVEDPFNELQRRWSTWMDHVHPRWRDTPPEKR